MSEELKNNQNPQEENTENTAAAQEQYSLNDDRRVKTLSPGRLVAKRFFRNRVAVTGLVILAFMFVFSFIGGAVTPYAEDQLFYREDSQNKQYAGVTENTELRYVELESGASLHLRRLSSTNTHMRKRERISSHCISSTPRSPRSWHTLPS